jgi:glutathione S-transferase
MRLSEQREALLTSSQATSPPLSRQDGLNEPHFLTDEDALNQSFQTMSDAQDPEEAPVWLVGEQCSVADLCFLTWANVVDRIGIDLETEFPVFSLSFGLVSDTAGGSKVG